MIPTLVSLAERQNSVVTTAQARECGYSTDEIRGLVRGGTWVALRRGRYVAAEVWQALDGHGRLAARSAAVLLGFRTTVAAVSHATAAGLMELPVTGLSRRPIEVTTASGNPRRVAGLVVHAHQLPASDLAMAGGWLLSTSPARTIADCLRTAPFEDAVALADAALHRGITEIEAIRRALGSPSRPGSRAAERVLRSVDGRAESPGESRARLQIEAAFPGQFDQQVVVRGASGRAYRLDFAHRALKVAGEYDGKGKYDTREDLIAEKVREDDLRATGWQFFRLVAEDLAVPGRVRSVVGRAMGLALRAS